MQTIRNIKRINFKGEKGAVYTLDMKHLPAKLSDSELVELSKNNPDYFETLVVRYQSRLFYYAKRISYFEKEDIEDILQEVFIKAYKNLNAFDSSFAFSSWIYHIARNCVTDAIRKKHARPQTTRLEDTEVVTLFKSSTDIENELIIQDRLDKVKTIINNLPFKYKEVLILKFLEGMTYEEIMDVMEKPKGTVAALINRGRKKLLAEAGKQGIITH